MTARRIESPRYGMVVTDGIAGRVFMLVCRTHPHIVRGDYRLVWEALQIGIRGEGDRRPVMRARVYLAPGEFAEVVPGEYEFVGGPADGKRYATGGSTIVVVPSIPPPSIAFDDEPLTDSSTAIQTVDYELRRDGRYHVVGGA